MSYVSLDDRNQQVDYYTNIPTNWLDIVTNNRHIMLYYITK